MKSLLIDTATHIGLVVVGDGDKVLSFAHFSCGFQTGDNLWSSIDAVLKEGGCKIEDISYIGCGVGPGSYTGIRAGVAAAKGLQEGLQCKLVGVPSIHLFVPEEKVPYSVVIDARIGGFYWYDGKEELLLTKEELLERKPILMVTPQKKELLKKLPECHIEEVLPSPEEFVQRAYVAFIHNEWQSPVELLYLRKTQPEIERQSTF